MRGKLGPPCVVDAPQILGFATSHGLAGKALERERKYARKVVALDGVVWTVVGERR